MYYFRKHRLLLSKQILKSLNKDRLIIIIIFHNTALCYQMLGSLEDSALFLETCILNLEILSMMPLFQKTETKWKILTLECLLRMQLCALLSQLHRHQEALYHAQIAVRISHFLMRDLKSFIKSLVYREHILKLESNIKSIKNNMNKEIGTNDSKPTSSRIELKSNHSIESLKRTLKSPTMKSERDSKRENESNIKKGDKILDENEPIINQEDPDSIYSIENEIDTMSILLKGYKKVYPLIEFIEKNTFSKNGQTMMMDAMLFLSVIILTLI